MGTKVICHIDLNTFFVRCEEIRNPKLEGKAVAIGHEGRAGILSTSSYEARKFGAKAGMPTFKAKQACPHLIILPVDFKLYNKKSKEFFNYVKRFTKMVEVASIDECYADFTNVIKGKKDPIKFFEEFQQGLFKETKLKCSIGIAPTKFLAKMASDMKKPMGITVIHRKDSVEKLSPLPIEDFFGIGKKTSPRLRAAGIETIGDLYTKIKNNDETIKMMMGKFYYVIPDLIEGNSSDELDLEPWDPKSIGNSTTLFEDTEDFNEIKQTLDMLSKEVSERCVKENKVGSTIQIVVKDTQFKVKNKSQKLDKPTNDYKVIYDTAVKLYEKNYLGMTVRLVGVTLQNLVDPREVVIQMSFFDYEMHEEQSATKLLINELNRKLDKPLLMRASEAKKK
ncbi:MAG: DNA polymerase IV [Bacilli bacterium]|nr:DNA polymerase IV [Bacilli bacterium]